MFLENLSPQSAPGQSPPVKITPAQRDLPAADLPRYRAPELHALGDIRRVQGRNFYSDRDVGNNRYYV